MPVALGVLAVALLVYCGVQGATAWGVRQTLRRPLPPAPSPWPSVSVIVPARNEADAIAACLCSIRANRYPGPCEVIVVDDFSTDATAAIVARHIDREAPLDAPVRLLRLDAHMPHNPQQKQGALQAGIAQATGAVVLTTDADCTVGPRWIETMARFCTPETPFVAGPVRYRTSPRTLGRFQGVSIVGAVALGAGHIALGAPTFCNSANVAYRRALYLAGRAHLPEGPATDELLLQHVAYATDQQPAFAHPAAACVTTDAVASWRAFMQQRVRWASTGATYPHGRARALLAAYMLPMALLLLGALGALALPAWRLPVAAAFALKALVDAALVVPAARAYRVPFTLPLLAAVVLAEGPLVCYAALRAAVAPGRWKGRPL
ncbi:glycosyltransferase [Salisaeta longa]|uniref:glycosyltransferase n=1 Tax=Salisaeta longa TaxID=503170 RepID=UPI0003B6F5CA|nr:glycosyltransferase [Salisaeta longa]